MSAQSTRANVRHVVDGNVLHATVVNEHQARAAAGLTMALGATGFAYGKGRAPEDEIGMMSAQDVADLVMFVITRPRGMRILETAMRPMTEESWG